MNTQLFVLHNDQRVLSGRKSKFLIVSQRQTQSQIRDRGPSLQLVWAPRVYVYILHLNKVTIYLVTVFKQTLNV